MSPAPNKIVMDWKTRLYNGYVSSGQANASLLDHPAVENPETVFGPRSALLRDIISRHLPRDREAKILDLACGHGAFLHFLRIAGYKNCSGIDISPEQIELAHKLGVSEAYCGDIVYELKRARSGSVDAIMLMDILEHLENDDLFELLDNTFRVLTKDGICLAHVPNGEGLYGMRVRFGDLTHARAFTPRSAGQLFRTIGFAQVECFEEVPVVHGIKSLIQRAIWTVGTAPHRVLLASESGIHRFVLSQNMLIKAHR
jgi:SAM-dependent methyltransferase